MSAFLYRIKSGALDETHECPYPADAEAVAVSTLERASVGGKAPNLGVLLEVSGEQYSGDEAIYFSTVQLLRRIGRMEPDA